MKRKEKFPKDTFSHEWLATLKHMSGASAKSEIGRKRTSSEGKCENLRREN